MPVHSWFAGGNDGTARTTRSNAQSEGTSLAAPAGISHRLLYSAVEREEKRMVPATTGRCNYLERLSPDERFSRAIPAGRLLFCYQPAVDPESDLLLWHRTMLPLDHANKKQDGASVVLRWFSSCGNVLVWESKAHTMRCSEDRYWQPLAARLPLWPRGADWLRFEICSACEKRTPLATGFIFPDSRAPEHPGPDELPGVLALCLTTAETVRVKFAHKPLAELLASVPRVAVEIVQNAGQSWATIDVSSFEYLVDPEIFISDP
jgi:hypothetical protein